MALHDGLVESVLAQVVQIKLAVPKSLQKVLHQRQGPTDSRQMESIEKVLYAGKITKPSFDDDDDGDDKMTKRMLY